MWPQLIPMSFKESQDDLLKPGAQQRVLCSSLPVRKRLRQRRDRTVDVDYTCRTRDIWQVPTFLECIADF